MDIRNYYNLTKPGIIYGNLITATAGFFLASQTSINLLLLIKTLLAISFVIASACVFNNLIDRKIDAKMTRTKERALPKKHIPLNSAKVLGSILGFIGFIALFLWTNPLTFSIGIIAYIDYIIFYGITKRKSVYGTLVGSISGAAPIVAGYTAVTGRFDLVAVLLFLIMVFWQMVHFYSIAISRLNDYKSAGIVVLPAVSGIKRTKIEIIIYTIAFVVTCILLGVFGYAGKIYLLTAAVIGIYWFYIGILGFKSGNNTRWARKMFLFSLVAITGLSVVLYLNSFLP